MADRVSTFFRERLPAYARTATLFFYDEVLVTLSVLTTVGLLLFDITDEGPMQYAVLFLAPALISVINIIMARITLALWDNGLFKWIWRRVIRAYTTGRFYFIGGIEILNQYKVGRYLWTLAVLNLFWLPYWMWYNVDVFKILKSMAQICVDLANYFTDPKAIVKSFYDLLAYLHVAVLVAYLKHWYIEVIKKLTWEGSVTVLWYVLGATFFLFLLGGIAPFLRHHFGTFYMQGYTAAYSYWYGDTPLVANAAETTHTAGSDDDDDDQPE